MISFLLHVPDNSTWPHTCNQYVALALDQCFTKAPTQSEGFPEIQRFNRHYSFMCLAGEPDRMGEFVTRVGFESLGKVTRALSPKQKIPSHPSIEGFLELLQVCASRLLKMTVHFNL